MRRVVVTGLGAVTPIGGDVAATWESALAGRSGIDFIRAFDPEGFPVRIAAEVKDFDPTTVVSAKEARKLDRNVLLAVASAKEAVDDAALNGFDPSRVGIVFGSAIGGFLGIMEQADVLRERGPDRVSPNSSPTSSSIRRAGSWRSRWEFAVRTTLRSRRARPARTPSARARS